jgi:hypothetical protein
MVREHVCIAPPLTHRSLACHASYFLNSSVSDKQKLAPEARLGRRFAVLALSFAAILATGCGSSSSSKTGQLRFMQASPSAPHVDVLIDKVKQGSNLAYVNTTGYLTVKVGNLQLDAEPVNSTSPILSLSVPITESGKTTVLMTGSSGNITSLSLTDGGTTSTTGDGYVRVVNASVSMGAADVYIVPAGSGISGVTPVATNLALNQSAGYHLTPAGNYEVFMTSPGTSNVLLDSGPLNLASLENWTFIALDGVAGGFSFTQLKD